MTDDLSFRINLPCGHMLDTVRHIAEEWRNLHSAFRCPVCNDPCCFLTPAGERQSWPLEKCVVLGTGLRAHPERMP